MQHGLNKYSILGCVLYTALLCGNALAKDIQSASRIGKAAMSCFNKRYQSSAELVPRLYLAYSGEVAPYFEPLQSCAEMARQGFNAALSRGENRAAFLNAMQHIKILIFAGEKLPTILEKVDFYLKLADQYKNAMAKIVLSILRNATSTLIDKGESASSKINDATSGNAYFSAIICRYNAIQAYWLGYNERCHYYVEKEFSQHSDSAQFSSLVLTFLHGLSTFPQLKRRNIPKLRLIPRSAIATLKAAASHSQWNFCNKVRNLHDVTECDSFSRSHPANTNLTIQQIIIK